MNFGILYFHENKKRFFNIEFKWFLIQYFFYIYFNSHLCKKINSQYKLRQRSFLVYYGRYIYIWVNVINHSIAACRYQK